MTSPSAVTVKPSTPWGLVLVLTALTAFGPLSLELRVARDGRTARLKLDPPRRNPPARVVLHLDHWSGQAGVLELPVNARSVQTVVLGAGLTGER